VANAIAITIAISIAVANSVAITVAVTHCHCRQPLPLWLPSTITSAVSVALPSAIAIAVAIAIGHCRLCHHWPSQFPSPLAITVAVAGGHFQELLPWCSKNCILPIEAKNACLIFFFFDSGLCTDQSRMTDQVSSSNCQHQHWAASGKHQAASEGSGWQQGGSRGAAGCRR
jgi:hypothetical protein